MYLVRVDVSIICSVLSWRTPSYYIFIRKENSLLDIAHLLLQACITPILRRVLYAQPRDAHLR